MAILDDPYYQEIILNNIANTGFIEGCTKGVPARSSTSSTRWLSPSAFYRYWKNHPEFQERVEKAKETFKLKFPQRNPEYWKLADNQIKKYLLRGNEKTHVHESFKVNSEGEYIKDRADKHIYNNGTPRWVLEKVLGQDSIISAQVAVIVANQLKILSQMTDISQEHREAIEEFLTHSQEHIEKVLLLLREDARY